MMDALMVQDMMMDQTSSILVLTCLLPPSYPNKDSPYFTITVKWMDEAQVSQLCEMLDNIWEELQGQEVVYQWVEWLRDSSRSHLWFDDKMRLGPDIVIHYHDNRAVSRTNSLESLIPLMMT
jgi:E3 ubiquitin-protein ligase RNF14